MTVVGKVDKRLINNLGVDIPQGDICLSDGLEAHLRSSGHDNVIQYLSNLPKYIKTPKYIGQNNNHKNSFEIVVEEEFNVLIAIKLSIADGEYFVATMHDIPQSKINKRLHSGRLKKYK